MRGQPPRNSEGGQGHTQQPRLATELRRPQQQGSGGEWALLHEEAQPQGLREGGDGRPGRDRGVVRPRGCARAQGAARLRPERAPCPSVPAPRPRALRPAAGTPCERRGYRAWVSRCCAPDGQAAATPGFGEEGASRTLGCQRPSPRATPVCCVQVRSKCEATLWVGGCIWLLKYLDFIYVVLESNKVDRCA